jgi:hypothetical protein
LRFHGDFGGLASADGLCNTAAAGAGMGGMWKAWLSASTTDAIDRIADVGPWALVTCPEVFANKSALAGTPATAPDVDEKGFKLPPADPAWTATRTGGTRQNMQTCGDWTIATSAQQGGFGLIGSVDVWTDDLTLLACSQYGHLYCIEQ